MSVETEFLSAPVAQFDLTDYCMVTPSTTVRETVERMRDMNRHTAFVVGDHTVLQGIITDRDVMLKVVTAPELWDNPVTDVMTPEPTTLKMTATAAEALRLMDDNGFRNVPIVNDKGIPSGNLTYHSLVDYLGASFQNMVLNAPPRRTTPEHVTAADSTNRWSNPCTIKLPMSMS
jgi:CBS domain-containing protein